MTSENMTSDKNKTLDPEKLCKDVVAFLEEGKAKNVVAIDLSDKSTLGDYMIIASGTSSRFLSSMADRLKEMLHKKGISPVYIEGLEQCEWVLIDAMSVIIHIFQPEVRERYSLEDMWSIDIKRPENHKD